MKKVINCFKEENPLINKPLREVSVEEGMKIATELFEILNKRQDGIGLAANQVGIDAQVAVVNVREPIILINPKYVEKGNEIPYYEGCLSFHGKGVNTRRYDSVIIKTEQCFISSVFEMNFISDFLRQSESTSFVASIFSLSCSILFLFVSNPNTLFSLSRATRRGSPTQPQPKTQIDFFIFAMYQKNKKYVEKKICFFTIKNKKEKK